MQENTKTNIDGISVRLKHGYYASDQLVAFLSCNELMINVVFEVRHQNVSNGPATFNCACFCCTSELGKEK